MKRVFLIAAIVLAVLVTGLFSLLWCAKLNIVHQFVISRVNNVIPGTLTIGSIHLSFLDMRVDIRSCALADSSGKELAGFDRLLIDVSTLGLLRKSLIVEKAVLEQPWALLEVDSGGKLSLLNAFPKGQPDTVLTESDSAFSPFPVEIEGLNIIGGKIFFAAEQDSLKVQAYGLSISAKGETGSFSGDITVAFDSLDFEKADERLKLYDLALMTQIRNMDIDTVDLRVHTDNSTFALNGRASALTGDPDVNLAIVANLALPEISSLAGFKDSLSGSTALRMHLWGKVSSPDLELDLTYGGGNVLGYPVKSLFLKSRLADRVLKIDPLYADVFTGSVDVSGSVDVRRMFPGGFLAQPGSVEDLRYDLAISGKGVPLKKLAPDLSGVAEVSIALQGRGANPDSLDANLLISATIAALRLDTSSLPLDAAFACSLGVDKGVARIHSLTGKLGTGDLSLNGLYGISSGVMDASLDLSLPELGDILRFTGTDSVSGSAAVKMNVRGDLKNPEAVIDLKADTVAFGARRIGNITLSSGLDKSGTAWIKEMVLTNRSSQIRLAGSAHVLHNGMPVPVDSMKIDLSLSSQGIVIGDFIDSTDGRVDIALILMEQSKILTVKSGLQ